MQTIPYVYYSWSEEIVANIVMETPIKQFVFVVLVWNSKTGETVDSCLLVTIL